LRSDPVFVLGSQLPVHWPSARQQGWFDRGRTAKLDDPTRFVYPPAQDIARLLGFPTGGKLVGFRTVTGTQAIELARLSPDIKAIALDWLSQMLDRLRAKRAVTTLANFRLVRQPTDWRWHKTNAAVGSREWGVANAER
jgi:hypothetical protein